MSDIRCTHHARADLIDIYCRNADPNPDSAERLFDAIQRAVTLLQDAPHLGRLWNSHDPRLKGVRVMAAGPYSHYLVLFRPLSSGIEVTRVVHVQPSLAAAVNDSSQELNA